MKLPRYLAVAIVLLFALGACGPKDTPTPEPTPIPPTHTPLPPTDTPVPPTDTPVPPTDTPAPPTDTPVPGDTAVPPTEPLPVGTLPLADEEFRSEMGGFALHHPEGWVAFDLYGLVIIVESEEFLIAEELTSPIIVAMAGPPEEFGDIDPNNPEETVEAMLEGQDLDDAEVEQITPMIVGGENAVAIDFTGVFTDTEAAGRAVIVAMEDWVVLFSGLGPVEVWDAFLPTFNAMLDTVYFFPAQGFEMPTASPGETAPPEPTREAGEPPDGFVWRIEVDTGEDDESLYWPEGMDFGPDGNLYVADAWQAVVFVISPDGEFLDVIGVGDMYYPEDVKVAADGTIFVADWSEPGIFVYSPDGELLDQWGEEGAGEGQFGAGSPEYLAVCPNDLVYVADSNEDEAGEYYDRVQVFDQQGNYQFQVNVSAIDEFFTIGGMDCDEDGYVYLSDWFGNYVMVLDPDGNHVADLGEDALGWETSLGPLAIGPDNNIYLATYNGWIGVLDLEGNLIAQWGTEGDGEGSMAPGEFYVADGITVDSAGNVYVSEETDTFAYLTKFYFPELR